MSDPLSKNERDAWQWMDSLPVGEVVDMGGGASLTMVNVSCTECGYTLKFPSMYRPPQAATPPGRLVHEEDGHRFEVVAT